MSDQTLIQQARDIAADQYIRLQVKSPTPHYSATAWADQIQSYATFLREGAYDNDLAVVSALEALRSVAA